MSDIERIRVAAELAANPMYQLSTAGHELFHTDMLYWLASHRPNESRPVWDLLGVDAPPLPESLEARGPIRREWHHIDLALDSGMPGRKLILENKVTAIATAEQLERYHAKISRIKPYDRDTTSWRLLSLLPVRFQPPSPWEAVSYLDLLPALDETAMMLTGDDRALVSAYAQLVRRLVALVEVFDPAADLDAPRAMASDVTDELTEARALSLVRKLQMNRCAELLHERLEGVLPSDHIRIESGLTNTQGLMSLFLAGPAGRHFGWQVQGDQLRTVVITSPRDPKKRPARERLVEQHHLDYFELDPPPVVTEHLQPVRTRKAWLGYEPDFVYRYQRLAPRTTWRDLLHVLVWASEHAQSYVSAPRQDSPPPPLVISPEK